MSDDRTELDSTMLSIGDLARRTGVSVRMLRHWDAIGLVRPAVVDEDTGYRWYATSQVGRVQAVVTLRELDFSLVQCGTLLDDQLAARDLADALQSRHDELSERIAADTRRLAEVRRRLLSIEEGRTMTLKKLRLGPLPELHVIQARTQVADTAGIAGAIEPLQTALDAALARLAAVAGGVVLDGSALEEAGSEGTTPGALALGDSAPGAERVHTFYGHLDSQSVEVAVAAALPDGIDPARLTGLPEDVEIARIPAIVRGARVELHGDDLGVGDAWRLLDEALAGRGLASYGLYRRVLRGQDAASHASAGTGAVTAELQCPVLAGEEACSPSAHEATRSSRL